MKYAIYNLTSGAYLGSYVAESEASTALALCMDAGYACEEDAQAVLGYSAEQMCCDLSFAREAA